MLHLDQTRNRSMLMVVSVLVTIALVAVSVPGINAVGILLVVAIVNIVVYYTLPDSYSKACRDRQSYRFHQ